MSRKSLKSTQFPRPRIYNNTDDEQIDLLIDVDYKVSEEIPLQFSDNFLVMFRDAMFHIYFMQNQQPLILKRSDVSKIKSVKSICLARFAITPFQLARNLAAMEDNFNKFLRSSNISVKNYKEFLDMMSQKQNNEVDTETEKQEE